MMAHGEVPQRCVVMTGCSSGIGRQCAIDLSARGWLVFAGVRRPEDAQQLRAAHGQNLRPILLDITCEDSIASCVQRLGGELGDRGLDALVNNAGILIPGPLELISVAQLRHQFDVNVMGSHAITRAFLPFLKSEPSRQGRRGRSRLVFMGSISGRITPPCYGVYAASKHALEAMASAWRMELRTLGVAVSIIEPDIVATPLWDKSSSRIAQMEDDWAAQQAASYAVQLRSVRRSGLLYRKSGMAPEFVVDAVRHALQSRRPRANYPVGWRTRAAFVAARLLPTRVMDFLLTRSS